MTETCPNARALSDAHARGDVALAAHAERCDACKKEWAVLSEIRSVSRAIPYQPMSPERIRAVRAQIVMATRGTRQLRSSHRAYVAIAAGVLLIALGFGSVLLRKKAPAEDSFLATVTSLSGPRPRRVSMLQDGARREVVTVVTGRVDFEVAKLSAGERFLVITDDAEVEVRGTRFEVEAKGGILQEVKVLSGIVEVRPRDRDTVLLHPGERWIRATIEAPAAVQEIAPAPPPPPAPAKKKAAPKPKRIERSATEAERAFKDGWTAYREGRTKDAAQAFQRVMELAPNTPIAEDAKYWRGRAMDGGGGF